MSLQMSALHPTLGMFLCVTRGVTGGTFFFLLLRSTWRNWGRSAYWTSMSVSRSKRDSGGRRYNQALGESLWLKKVLSRSLSLDLLSCDVAVWCLPQYDSDGSDSQESTEEAELRRKKIEALKVSLQATNSIYSLHFPYNSSKSFFNVFYRIN